MATDVINFKQWKEVVTAAIQLLDEVTSALPLPDIRDALEEPSTSKSALDLVTTNEEGAKALALYLAFSIVPTHLKSAYQLLAGEFFYEAHIMIRSLAEALDLVELFSRDRCKAGLATKWLEGDIIPNRDSRTDSTGFFWRGEEMILGQDFFHYPEARRVLAKLRAKYYAILSGYVHHTAGSIIQAVFYRDKSKSAASAFEAFNNELVRTLSYFQKFFGEFLDESSHKQLEHAMCQVRLLFSQRRV